MGFATAIAVTSAVASGIGVFQQNRANRKAERQQAQISNSQAQLSSRNSALENQRNELALTASREQAAISREQEQLRRDQASRNFAHLQRNIVRQRQIARANAVTGAAGAGALNSSALQGGVGQILQSAGANLVANRENFAAGEQQFELNERLVSSQERFNIASGDISRQQAALGFESGNLQAQLGNIRPSQTGNIISAFGASAAQNAGAIARVGQQIFQQPQAIKPFTTVVERF